MESEVINKEEIESEVLPIRRFAETVTVKNDEQNFQASEYLKKIKTSQKMVQERFKPIIEKAFQAHRSLTAFRDEFLNPLKDAELKIKTAMVQFETEMERECQRLQAEQEAEARRIEAEARKAQEQAAKLAEKGKEEKAIVKQISADAIQAKADEIRQTVIEKPMAKVAGISYKDNWTAVITNISEVPREYLVPNMTALNSLAKATKGTLKIAGVEFKNERTVASRSY